MQKGLIMRLTRVVVATILLWSMQAGVAFAYYDDGWIEKLSGPGPFQRYAFPLRVACFASPMRPLPETSTQQLLPPTVQNATPTFAWLWPLQPEVQARPAGSPSPDAPTTDTARMQNASINCAQDQNVHSYITVDIAWGKSKDNVLFDDADPTDAAHRVKFGEVGLSFVARVHRMVDLSAGVGVTHFYGESFESSNRVYITPMKVTVSPFAAKDRLIYRALQFYVGTRVYVGGGFTDSDFCAPQRGCSNAARFSNTKELQWTAGWQIEPVILVKGLVDVLK